jgi:hypothetical protein
MSLEKYHEYQGAIHIHSNFSDGTRSIPEIAQIARTAGLDFLIVTDHMTLRGLDEGCEQWYNNLLVLVGYEINDPANRNHYLAMNMPEILPVHESAPQYVRDIKSRGGLGFIAHPDEERQSLPEYPSYPWTAWDVDGFNGIEIWNQMSAWMEQINNQNKYLKFFSPRKSINTPPPQTLRRWDELAQRRRVVGIGGVDVHDFIYRFGFLKLRIFPYKVYFKSIRTHLLLSQPLVPGNLPDAKKCVYDCLQQGRAFFSNFRRGDAFGFRFWAEKNNQTATMGETITMNEGGVDLWARAPKSGEFRLVHSGRIVAESHGREFFYSTDLKGVYRIEVLRKNKGWIYSNHININ